MKLYFYTANTSEQYGNLGISLEICEAEEKPKTYRSSLFGLEAKIEAYIDGEIDELPLAKKEDIGRLINNCLILTKPDFEYAKNKFVERAEEKVCIAKETLKRAEHSLKVIKESEERLWDLKSEKE